MLARQGVIVVLFLSAVEGAKSSIRASDSGLDDRKQLFLASAIIPTAFVPRDASLESHSSLLLALQMEGNVFPEGAREGERENNNLPHWK